MHDTETMLQDNFDEQFFSWLEFPDDFILTSNKRLRFDDEVSMSLDDTSLFISKTTDVLNSKKCKINKETSSKVATMESTEG